ncbi:MAG: hypothetical protein KKE73_05190 [Proteobacteria bacterium]|nr:hypothetical protein [Pseudomonadota bacterium]
MNWPQIILAVLSGSGIFLIAQGSLFAGCILGLAAQPFWIRETYRARQWGMFALSLWYTFAWSNGLFVSLGR